MPETSTVLTAPAFVHRSSVTVAAAVTAPTRPALRASVPSASTRPVCTQSASVMLVAPVTAPTRPPAAAPSVASARTRAAWLVTLRSVTAVPASTAAATAPARSVPTARHDAASVTFATVAPASAQKRPAAGPLALRLWSTWPAPSSVPLNGVHAPPSAPSGARRLPRSRSPVSTMRVPAVAVRTALSSAAALSTVTVSAVTAVAAARSANARVASTPTAALRSVILSPKTRKKERKKTGREAGGHLNPNRFGAGEKKMERGNGNGKKREEKNCQRHTHTALSWPRHQLQAQHRRQARHRQARQHRPWGLSPCS